MIIYTRGNLIEANVEALVNTVNCVGVMGKGIALQFKQAFPDNFKIYKQACDTGRMRLGQMLVVPANLVDNPRYIINFPTKRHWKGKSRIEDIKTGLADLVIQIKQLNIGSIAIPALGCGNGGLLWSDVAPLIESAFAEVADIDVLVYTPEGAPENDTMSVATKRPNMTRTRAILICLFEAYQIPGYRLSLLEMEKLAYFLQYTGEDLKLKYDKYQYGPYTETLNHVLQRIEGHFIRGYGDRTRQAEVYLLPEATAEAADYLALFADAHEHLTRVKQLIDGFETPFGLELLASVHWVSKENAVIIDDLASITEAMYSWNERKRAIFKPHHIRTAWQRLKQEGWLSESGKPA